MRRWFIPFLPLLIHTVAPFFYCLPGSVLLAQGLDPEKRLHHYVKNTWSVEEGLPQMSVHDIAQDSQGYLWVATLTAVARFDGVRFEEFHPGNTPDIPGKWVRSIHLAEDGTLWIGTYKGVTAYRNGIFTRMKAVSGFQDKIHKHPDIRDMCESNLFGMVAASSSGLLKLSNEGILPMKTGLDIQPQSLLCMKNELLVGSIGGVFRISTEQKAEFLPLPDKEQKTLVNRLVKYKDQVFAGTNKGLFYGGIKGWRRFSLQGDAEKLPVEGLYADSMGILWVSTQNGLCRYSDKRPLECIPNEGPSAHGLVISFYEDHEGSLWMGSHHKGLARLWNGWTKRLSSQEGLHEVQVSSVAPGQQGDVWVGTMDGLAVYRNGSFHEAVPGFSLPHPLVYTLLAEPDIIWIGTRSGLAILREGRVETPDKFLPMASAQINGIHRTSSGTLWFATTQGVFRLDGETLVSYGPSQGLTEIRARVLLETRHGRLLVGTQSGVFELTESKAVPIRLPKKPQSDYDITALAELPNERLLAGTLTEELLYFDGASWHALTSDDGIPKNSAFYFALDSKNHLWVAGIRGLYRLSLDELERKIQGTQENIQPRTLLSVHSKNSGAQKGECCNGAGNAKGFFLDGVLWLPTADGVVTVDTVDFQMNPIAPRTLVESVHFGKQWKHAHRLDGKSLKAEHRDLTFRFTALSFQDPGSMRFAYRLKGYDSDWLELEDSMRRQVRYTNLPPGRYTFQVRASNNAGVWSQTHAELTFRIRPRFVETFWFPLLIGFAVLILTISAIRWRTRRLVARKNELEAIVSERTEKLRQANVQLEEASRTDALTGLLNRRYLYTQMPKDLAYFNRELGVFDETDPPLLQRTMVFAMVDIDHFKKINDTHGHNAGDEVLQQFSIILADTIRLGDYLIRWGGEEFLLVLRSMPKGQTTKIIERIRSRVAESVFNVSKTKDLHLTCSIGFSEYPLSFCQGALNWEIMVELADQALYHVKQTGRNGWAFFRPAAGKKEDLDLDLNDLEDLSKLIEDGTIELARSPCYTTEK